VKGEEIMEMSKIVIFHKLNDENERPRLERWMRRYHIPEVLNQTPWTIRYQCYRPVPHPPGAEAFGLYNYRLHETWALDNSMRRGTNGILSMTPRSNPEALQCVCINVPAEATDDFKGAENIYDDHTILRWVVGFRYPDSVSPEEGDDWYLNVHVPEVMRQSGLHRFFSHKANVLDGPPLPIGKNQRDYDRNRDPNSLFFKQWHRLSEMWYENNNGWVESVLQNPPAYTKPKWATYDRYPFLIPGSEFVSCFLLESPDQDHIREFKTLYC
jgi:hypothetical protein